MARACRLREEVEGVRLSQQGADGLSWRGPLVERALARRLRGILLDAEREAETGGDALPEIRAALRLLDRVAEERP
jgi:hypothetical protein